MYLILLLLHYSGNWVELQVLQGHTAGLTFAIAANPVLFGQHLVQYEFAVQATVNTVYALGLTEFQQGSKLLNLVDTKIRTAGSKENARKYFNDFLKIMSEIMGNRDIVKSLVSTYSKCIVVININTCCLDINLMKL